MEKTTRKDTVRRGLLPVFYLVSLIFYLASCEQTPPVVLEEDEDWAPVSVEIGSAADLKKIGRNRAFPPNGRYTLTQNLTLDNWVPLKGDYSGKYDGFAGVFDGDGHTITITGGSGGLFAELDGATVRNLTVNVTVGSYSGEAAEIGGIAGYAEGSMIEDCTVRMTAVVEAAAELSAIVGGIAGNVRKSVIENCTAVVDLAVTGHGHNSSSGGIVGTMGNFSTVRNCTAQGTITLTGIGSQLMVYAGGIAGYSGTPGLAGSGDSDCVIERSWWTGEDSEVTASGGYPYAGGIVGYNYSGAKVERCRATGTVRANGENLPYAGGVAGYNSQVGKMTGTPATIENCYSTATVKAVSDSKFALAGGVTGANAAGAFVSKCYATGAVTARITGDSTADNGGSIGPMAAASAGGIAGAQYVSDKVEGEVIAPAIEKCAALNGGITGEDCTSGADAWNIYRIAGAGASGSDTGVFTENIAWSEMPLTNHTETVASNANGKDGADCVEKPLEPAYKDMGWDFSGVWTMDKDGFPVFR